MVLVGDAPPATVASVSRMARRERQEGRCQRVYSRLPGIPGEPAPGILRETGGTSGGCKGRPRATGCPVSPSRCSHSVGAGPEGRSPTPPVRPTPDEIRHITAGCKLEGQVAGGKTTRAPTPPGPTSRPAEPGGPLLYDGHDGVLPVNLTSTRVVCQLGTRETYVDRAPTSLCHLPSRVQRAGPSQIKDLVFPWGNIRLNNALRPRRVPGGADACTLTAGVPRAVWAAVEGGITCILQMRVRGGSSRGEILGVWWMHSLRSM